MTGEESVLGERLAALDRRMSEAVAVLEARQTECADIRWSAHGREHALLDQAQDKYEGTADQWRKAANEWREQIADERATFATQATVGAELSRLEAGRVANADHLNLVERNWAGVQAALGHIEAHDKAISALQLWQANVLGKAQMTAALVSVATSVLVGLLVLLLTHALH